MKYNFTLLFALLCAFSVNARFILIPMDDFQTDHLRAYGYAYNLLQEDIEVSWLLNYRGGAFLFLENDGSMEELLQEGIHFERLNDEKCADVLGSIMENDQMDAVVMAQPPKIAVYTAMVQDGPWDDAVVNVLNYAGIAYEVIYDDEILEGALENYDWLHMHHEDFTGQHNRLYSGFKNTEWYQSSVAQAEEIAARNGFETVVALKLAVAKKIRAFVQEGGDLFAMCTAGHTFEIALASEGLDIAPEIYDGDPADTEAFDQLDYKKGLAFENYVPQGHATYYQHSNLDVNVARRVPREQDHFTLGHYVATEEAELAMLTQNHAHQIHGFMGATTAFRQEMVKDNVNVLAALEEYGEARLVHGVLGKGGFTYYGGHDPEDYQHFIGEAAPNVGEFRNSPGYRLILNNVLFPSAKNNTDEWVKLRKLEIYPNPNPGDFELRFEASERMDLELDVYNALQQKVFSTRLMGRSGESTEHIDLGKVSKGVYFLELRAGTYAIKRKVVVQ